MGVEPGSSHALSGSQYDAVKAYLTRPRSSIVPAGRCADVRGVEPPTDAQWERHIAMHPAAIRTLVARLPRIQQVLCAMHAVRLTLPWYEEWTELAAYAIHAEIARCVELAFTSVPTLQALRLAPRRALDLAEQWLASPSRSIERELEDMSELAHLAGCAVAFDDYEEPAREVAFASGRLAEAIHAPSRFACADAIGSVASAVVRRHRKQWQKAVDAADDAPRSSHDGPALHRAGEYRALSAFLTRWWRGCRRRLAMSDALTAELR